MSLTELRNPDTKAYANFHAGAKAAMDEPGAEQLAGHCRSDYIYEEGKEPCYYCGLAVPHEEGW